MAQARGRPKAKTPGPEPTHQAYATRSAATPIRSVCLTDLDPSALVPSHERPVHLREVHPHEEPEPARPVQADGRHRVLSALVPADAADARAAVSMGTEGAVPAGRGFRKTWTSAGGSLRETFMLPSLKVPEDRSQPGRFLFGDASRIKLVTGHPLPFAKVSLHTVHTGFRTKSFVKQQEFWLLEVRDRAWKARQGGRSARGPGPTPLLATTAQTRRDPLGREPRGLPCEDRRLFGRPTGLQQVPRDEDALRMQEPRGCGQ